MLKPKPDACAVGCPAGEKHLYTVLEQQQAGIAAGNLMGSDHTYVMPDQAGTTSSRPMPAGAARR